jgi:hypothetical protein
MIQIVKKMKNGQEIKFICSTCGEIIYCVSILTGDKCEIDWDNLPEKCSCGAKLINRQPIIDADNLDIDDASKDMYEKISKDVHGNAVRNTRENILETRGTATKVAHEKSDVYKRYIKDFENAVSIDYFDMRLNGLKSGNFNVPENIDHLRVECIKRNIAYVELCVSQSSYLEKEYDKNELKERLKILRHRHNEMSKNYEDRKDLDFGKKRF